MLRKSVLLPFVLPILAVACDDDPAGPPANELVGTWNATSIELVSVASPDVEVDLVALGGSGTLVLAQGGTFTLEAEIPGEPPETNSGTWSSTDVLTMTFSAGEISGTWQFDINLSGDTLRLTGADTEFDFDGDDVEEAAKLDLTLTRA